MCEWRCIASAMLNDNPVRGPQIARMPHPTLPSLRAQLSVPRLRFFISAARVRRVLRVLRSALPGEDARRAPPSA